MLKKFLLVLAALAIFAAPAGAQTSQTISLKAGFNFVSFTTAITSGAAELKTANVFVEDIYLFSAAAGSFLSAAEGTLNSLAAGKGYIIKSSAAATLTVTGAALSTIGNITLKTGFNLIGFSKVPATTVTFSQLMTSYSDVKGLYKWSPAAGTFIQVVRDAGGLPSQIDGTDPQFRSAESYFINVTADTAINYEGSTIVVGTNPVVTPEKAATPSISPAAGTYTSAQSVTIACATSGATIYYTTDGTTPSASNGTAYSGAIEVSATTTIKAVAVKTALTDSDVASSAYTINIPANVPSIADITTDTIIPEVEISGGGVQASPAPSGAVYYFSGTSGVAGTKAESDIQMDDTVVKYNQTVKRYMRISGTASPVAAGYTDRFYHAVWFNIKNSAGTTVGSFSLPVDGNNKFDGYIYFKETGSLKVYSYRAQNDTLYPRAPSYIPVTENWSTLVFNVSCSEAVPSNLVYLLPTRDVNCGNKYVRDYAKYVVGSASTDTEKAKKIFEFLVNGDANGKFVYTYYNEIYPGILEQSWNSIFMPSHFLVRRRGVCNDFSETFAAMCRTHGMDVKRISGDDSTGAGHQWNSIYLDGAWKNVDATWANNNPNIYKTFAEFYPEFDAVEFTKEHYYKYTSNVTEEY
jgi:transglutaminase-like putative cysteine protease